MNHHEAPSKQPLSRAPALILPISLALLTLTACGRSPQTEPAAEIAAQPAPAVAEASQAEADRAAALAAKEKEIADREAAVQQREIEQQLAQRAAEAEAEAAAAKARCGRRGSASLSPSPTAASAADPGSGGHPARGRTHCGGEHKDSAGG
jgi:cobalamin biosynthesis Mg chelatase CobN